MNVKDENADSVDTVIYRMPLQAINVELPLVVMRHIASFTPSPVTLTLIGSTCRELSEFVTENEELWDRLYKRRWRMLLSPRTFTRQDYKEKHIHDLKMLSRLLEVSKEISQEKDYGLGQPFQNETWMQLRREPMQFHNFDLLRLIAKNKDGAKTFYPDVNISALTQCLAAQLLDMVHFLTVLAQWHSNGSRNITAEAGSLLFSRSMWTWEELLSDKEQVEQFWFSVCMKTIRDFGYQLKLRMDERGGVENMSTVDTLTLLSTMMFEEMGFSSIDAKIEHDPRNASIEHVLETRKGLPITLAMIGRFVLCQIGVPVDIYDLPGHVPNGHIILSLTDSETFVDMSNGQVLSLEDCQQIATCYGPDWIPELGGEDWTPGIDGPLDDSTILLGYMLTYVEHGYKKFMHESKTTRLYYALRKTRALAYMALSDSPHQALRWWCQRERFLDPEIFHHYGLIDDDTMNKYMDAPYDGVSIDRL